MTAKEFWHESLTEQSWKKLGELSKELDLTVIGGWAVWLWTKQHKSKDIDIIVDFRELSRLKERFDLTKNDKLRKYEAKLEGFDVDIYVPFYSRLTLPIEDLLKEKTRIEGINTVGCEALLVLKQGAETARKGTVKGQKDLVDILSILLYAPIDYRKYFELLEKHKKTGLVKELIREVTGFNPLDSEKYLGTKLNEFKKKKKEILTQIKKGRAHGSHNP